MSGSSLSAPFAPARPLVRRAFACASALAAGLWTLAAAPSAPQVGWVSGTADATYRIEAPGAPAPPAVSLDGFTQAVNGPAGAWTVRVHVDAAPLPVRQPFRPGKLPADLGLSPPQAAELGRSLASCQRADEAVEAVALFLRVNLRYRERASFEETPQQVLKRGDASCVGFARTASAILGAMGIPCREVVGLKIPLQKGPVRLEGGLLHAWLEVEFPGTGGVFCDPLLSFGWVPEAYVVLRVGGGLAPAELSRYTGGAATLLEHRDRIFYEPPPGAAGVLWARSPAALSTGTLLSGKLLGDLDLPATGTATLDSGGSSVSMPLWQGNYFFRDLAAGRYSLTLAEEGGKPRTAPVTLHDMERRFVVSYERADGQSRPGAAHEPRR